jgi:hypothetical protein
LGGDARRPQRLRDLAGVAKHAEQTERASLFALLVNTDTSKRVPEALVR